MAQVPNKQARGVVAAQGGLPLILDAATRLFAQNGYSGTSMKDVADDLGIQPPSIYNYVKSKRHILDLICMDAITGGRDAILTGFSVSDDFVVRLRRGIEEQVRFRLNHADAISVLARETLNLSPDVRTKVIGIRDEVREMWFGLVTTGTEHGVFVTPNARLSALLLQDMCNWLQVGHFRQAGEVAQSQLIYWYGDIALRMLLPSFTPDDLRTL